ncbi:CoA transferase [Rhodococcus sp. DK17]|uniref:CoA transferase n=2 Tax=Rhodococcus TaxID=1827 RepID=UPI0002E40EF7
MELTPGALHGLRVIDLTTVIMGPFATATLADMGADVIKVESLDGDMSRDIGARRHEGMSALTLNLQRNKRSNAIDPPPRRAVRSSTTWCATRMCW